MTPICSIKVLVETEKINCFFFSSFSFSAIANLNIAYVKSDSALEKNKGKFFWNV